MNFSFVVARMAQNSLESHFIHLKGLFTKFGSSRTSRSASRGTVPIPSQELPNESKIMEPLWGRKFEGVNGLKFDCK